MMKPLAVVLTVILSGTLACRAEDPDFRWERGTLNARLRGPDVLEMGVYLYIQRNDPTHSGWNMAKLRLPQNWKIESVVVGDQSVEMKTDHGIYLITPDNLKALRAALLEGDHSDPAVEKKWKQFAPGD